MKFKPTNIDGLMLIDSPLATTRGSFGWLWCAKSMQTLAARLFRRKSASPAIVG
jgi:hypothetical protein